MITTISVSCVTQPNTIVHPIDSLSITFFVADAVIAAKEAWRSNGTVEILITEQQKGPETALQEDLKDKRLRPILVMAAH